VAALDSADAERSLEARLEGARHAGEPAEAVQVEPAEDVRRYLGRQADEEGCGMVAASLG